MPSITRWHVRTALACLVVAVVLGVLMPLSAPIAGAFRAPYFHILMVGWATQLIFGIAYWMFPKFSSTHPRGDERLAWAVYGLLNGGLLVRIIAEPLAVLWPDGV